MSAIAVLAGTAPLLASEQLVEILWIWNSRALPDLRDKQVRISKKVSRPIQADFEQPLFHRLPIAFSEQLGQIVWGYADDFGQLGDIDGFNEAVFE